MSVSRRATTATAWVGMVFFGAIMMVLVGLFQTVLGLVALFNSEYYLVDPSGLVVSIDYSSWGWVHLGIGVIAIVTGFGIMLGQTWARVLGIVLAVLSALGNIAFLAAYPLWSATIIALDVVTIYALAVHGREVEDAYDA
jgi:hypothetical protein